MDFPGVKDLDNVVDSPEYASVANELAQMVREGWKQQRPPRAIHV